MENDILWEKIGDKPDIQNLEHVIHDLLFLTEPILLESLDNQNELDGMLVFTPQSGKRLDYCVAYVIDNNKIMASNLNLEDVQKVYRQHESPQKAVVVVQKWNPESYLFEDGSGDDYVNNIYSPLKNLLQPEE
jgi:hypothetical protein